MNTTFTPAEVFPPGDYLREELEERGWTVSEFAELIGRPIQAVSEILNAKKEITPETAYEFADALGTTPELWLNLQTNFKLHEARLARGSGPTAVARRARLQRLVPLAKAKKRGWLPDTDDLDELDHAASELLELSDLDDDPSFAIAARRSNSDEAISPEQIAWLAHIRRVGRERPVTTSFDLAGLNDLAAELPQRTATGPSALSKVPDWFAECGVKVVFAEGLPGGKLDGAVTFIGEGHPLIGLTTRGDRFDSLLFTLLHEVAHLSLEHIAPGDEAIVDVDVVSDHSIPIERDADERAAAWLFPEGFAVESSSSTAILAAAQSYGVHPSVIVGQIQRRTGNWRTQRKMIPKVRPDLAAAGLMQ